jgi:hypothetical protein
MLNLCLSPVLLLRTFYSNILDASQQAKILFKDNCGDLLVFASTTRHPLRDRLMSAVVD